MRKDSIRGLVVGMDKSTFDYFYARHKKSYEQAMANAELYREILEVMDELRKEGN